MIVQSVVFDKSKYSPKEARIWLKSHQYKVTKIDETDTQFRFRQMAPTTAKRLGYTDYATKPLGKSGISLILVYKPDGGKRGGDILKSEPVSEEEYKNVPQTDPFQLIQRYDETLNELETGIAEQERDLDNAEEWFGELLSMYQSDPSRGNYYRQQLSVLSGAIRQQRALIERNRGRLARGIARRDELVRENPRLQARGRGGKLRASDIRSLLDASYKSEPPNKIGAWVLDSDLSTDVGKVYYNPETGEAVVAHRGTSGAKDWANNLAYAFGRYEKTDRFKKGKRLQEQAEAKYGAKNISTLGHSQGSILSRKLGADTKEIINVNPAYKGEKPLKNEYNIRSSKDIVSGLKAPVNVVKSILYPSHSKIHDITIKSDNALDVTGNHSYDILSKLGDKEIGVGKGREGIYPKIQHSYGGSKVPTFEEYLSNLDEMDRNFDIARAQMATAPEDIRQSETQRERYNRYNQLALPDPEEGYDLTEQEQDASDLGSLTFFQLPEIDDAIDKVDGLLEDVDEYLKKDPANKKALAYKEDKLELKDKLLTAREELIFKVEQIKRRQDNNLYNIYDSDTDSDSSVELTFR